LIEIVQSTRIVFVLRYSYVYLKALLHFENTIVEYALVACNKVNF